MVPALLFGIAITLAPGVASAKTVRIMPFGDTATIGWSGKVGYRYPLWFKLQDAGFDVDFVGTKSAPEGGPDSQWYPDYYTTFDRDHQGYFAYQLNEMLPLAYGSARTEKPDVILLMAGFSDVFYGGYGAVSSAHLLLPEIIAEFRRAVPGVTILLSQVPPYLSRAGYPQETENRVYIEPLNEAIAEVAQALDSPESPIYLIDNHTGFDTDTMFCCRDFLTPDPDGEEWIADNFLVVLEDILPDIESSNDEGVQINAGMTDAWFNPNTNGQGMFIVAWEESRSLFLSWFTYDTERPPESAFALLGEPGHRWLTAQGTYEGDTADLTLYLTDGGIFDASAPPAHTDPSGYGSMTIQFAGCNEGTIDYEIPSLMLSGRIPIERVVLDRIPLCEALSPP